MLDLLVDMRCITKRFPGIVANAQVNFQVRRGEVHALLGENGAGKSTLMSILSGFYRPDEGEILVQGQKVVLRSPREALARGIGMVHQHFRLVETFTVTENVILGTVGRRFFLNRQRLAAEIDRFAHDYGLAVDPQAKVWQLSVGEKQRVEIIKLLYRGADLLILDEPTAVLTPQEVKELFHTLRRMADSGRAVILITHKLQEVMEVADRVTVLRKGQNIGTVVRTETNERELTRMMVDRDVLLNSSRRSYTSGTQVLQLEGLEVMGDRGVPALKNLTLAVRAGEILGIAGIAGNGQRELTEAITGLRPVIKGRVVIDGQDLTNKSAQQFIDAGVSSIPEDRLGTGLVPNLDVFDNAILKDYRRPPIGQGMFMNIQAARDKARRLVADFDIQVADLSYPVRLLSGGNLQRLLLARETSLHPKVVIASYPVRGLDIGATEAVYQLLTELREAGTAILLVSEDIDELVTLSDRIAVMFRGEIMGVVPADAVNIEELGLMMVGGLKTEVSVA